MALTNLRAEDQRVHRLLVSAREDERRRWARELHDETLQALGVLRVQLSAAGRAQDVATLHAAIDGAVAELGREIANLRSLITDLRPAALDELGLRPALQGLFDRAEIVHRLHVHTEVRFDPTQLERLEPELETAIYRIAQESLSNVGHHSGAQHVAIEISERRGEIVVLVADDGHGFDTEAVTTGFGLTGMRERVALVGGRLEIDSSSRGTAVVATLPARRERPVRRPARLGPPAGVAWRPRPRTGALREAPSGLGHSR
jgi:signal transduction histidine kinase